MSLKVGHKHVDQSGLVYLPYLHEWTARTHNLVELIANMSSVFGAEPPVSVKLLLSYGAPSGRQANIVTAVLVASLIRRGTS